MAKTLVLGQAREPQTLSQHALGRLALTSSRREACISARYPGLDASTV
jgi:hypothetical protein